MAEPAPALCIGMFIQHFPPRLGGAESQARQLAAALTARSQQVQVVTTRHEQGLPAVSEEDGFGVRRLPTPTPRWLKLPCNLLVGFYAGLANGRHLDVMHAHCLSPFVLGALLAMKLLRRPVLVKVCTLGGEGDVARIKRFGAGSALWRVYRQADRFIAQTSEMAEELVREGAGAGQVCTVPNLLAEQPPPEDPGGKARRRRALGLPERPTIAFVGRLHPGKGLALLMSAWEVISARHDVQLVLVGEGPMRDEIEAWRRRGPWTDSVILAGYRADPAPWYRAADLFVMPSRSEGFGNAIVEAMSHGLPVVATRVGAIAEWGDDSPVRLIEGGGSAELAAAVAGLLADETAREALGRRAYDFIRGRYGVDMVCERYLRVYREICARPPTAPNTRPADD